MVLVLCSCLFLSYLIRDAYMSGFKLYLKVLNSLLRSWDRDPSTSTIQRVKLSELDFPAITVCPDYATDSLATRIVLNMIEFDEKVRKQDRKSTRSA